jgi:hypothetical protein
MPRPISLKFPAYVMSKPISPIEQGALTWLHRESSILITKIPDKTEVDVVFGDRTPGMPTFKRLEKAGLCYITEEDPMFPEDGLDGPTWTPTVELTDLGLAWDPKNPSVFPVLVASPDPAAAISSPQGASAPARWSETVIEADIPRFPLRVVTHIGSLDPSRKGEAGSSYEGMGLSFSQHPEAWAEIAELGGIWWDADLTGLKIVDALACLGSPSIMKVVRAWAEQQGLVSPVQVFKASWLDTETDQRVEVWCATRKAALAEIAEQEDGKVRSAQEWAPTDRLCARMGFKRPAVLKPTPNTASEMMMAWAEDHGWDGAWWNERLNPSAYSAPRGVVFPSSIPKVVWAPHKDREQEIENTIRSKSTRRRGP